MKITIHRGSNQIGGNVIEISTLTTKLIFDCGAALPPIDDLSYNDDFSLDGLTIGVSNVDGVFISHHHGDHCGLINKINSDIAVYSGSETKRILECIADFAKIDRPNITNTFTDMQKIRIGDIYVTPILTDHSAKDSYMFLLEADSKTILYTGDFRCTSETIIKIKEILEDRILDCLVTEGTNIGYDSKNHSEENVADELKSLINKYDGTVFILVSSANYERINAIKKAAKETDRTVYFDLFAQTLQGNPPDKHAFIAKIISKNDGRIGELFSMMYERKELIGAKNLAKQKGKKIIVVRESHYSFIKKYLENCNREKNLLIYSKWKGYKKSKYTSRFLKLLTQLEIDIVDVHCSGHAYKNNLGKFIDDIAPKLLIPIHCENSARIEFKELHNNCYMSEDGEDVQI